MPGEWDIIVVGAGVLGAFHAYFASRKGLRTLLIERDDLPQEASVRNFGTLVPSAMTPGVWLDRAKESVDIYRDLAERLPFPLQTGGTQYLATTAAEWDVLEEFSRIGPALGYECRLLDLSESLQLNPIERSNCLGTLLFPYDARIEPRRFFHMFIPWLSTEGGCDFRPRTVVVGITESPNGCRVVTADGTAYACGHVFVCGGADLRTLFPEQFASAGLVLCKLQMLRLGAQPDVRLRTTIASGLSIRWYPSFQSCKTFERLRAEPVNAEVARHGIHVLMVQDEDGSIVVGDSHQYSSGDLDDTLDGSTESMILREARRLARLPSWDVLERWHGVYALHPERPIFQQTINERIHIVTGIGGKGMTTGPALARESIEQLI